MSPLTGTYLDMSVADRDAVASLRDLLARENYAQLYRHVGEGGLVAADVRRAAAAVRLLPARERYLLELLALGVPCDTASADRDLVDLVDALLRAGLARRGTDGGAVETTGWIVVPVLGGYLMSGVPAPYRRAESIGAPAYIGTDSLLLAAALTGTAGRRILDLGCGSGLQGLLAARGASEAVLTDVDDLSLRLSALNALLNDTAHAVSIWRGSLYEPVRAERFDTIAVLPPYVPRVAGSATSRSVDGGPDGLEFIRPLLAQATDHLTAGGELIAVCQLLCDADGPLLLRELEELAPGLDVRLSVSNWHPLQPYVLELATRLAAHGSPLGIRELMERYLTSLRGFGVTGACTADVRAIRVGAGAAARRRVVGRAPGLHPGAVPTPTAAFAVTYSGDLALVERGVGTPVALNRPTADLLGAVDGTRTVAEIVTRAWKAAPTSGPVRTDLEDQAMERFLELEAAGLVRVGR